MKVRDATPSTKSFAGGAGGIARRGLSEAGRCVRRGLVWGLVISVHVALFIGLSGALPTEPSFPDDAAEFHSMTYVNESESGLDIVPFPEVELRQIRVSDGALSEVNFEFPDEENIAGVIGDSSAPHLSEFQNHTAEEFAALAGVYPGKPETVILTVEIRPNGSVGEVKVIRTSGSARVDAAAIEYARLTRWVTGTVGHAATGMSVVFPVVLSRAAST